MANEEHLAILMEALEEGDIEIWNQWRREKRIPVNLSGANLNNSDLRDANLSRANLNKASLIGTDFSNAVLDISTVIDATLMRANLNNTNMKNSNFRFSNFSYANLSNANLRGANMGYVFLFGADLRFTNLSKVSLVDANLRGANMSYANLCDTNLRYANLIGTTLMGADFSDTVCETTIFSNVNLSQVKNLDKVQHMGPSTIGIDTLYKSHGNIPEIFLRGCGAPENLITYAKSLAGKAIDYYSVFISYSHADKAFARRVHDTLQGRGIRCWLDEKQLRVGDDIFQEVDRGIRYWDKILFCSSENSLSSWWCDNEILSTFEKEQRLYRERGEKVLSLIPLDLDGHLFSEDYQRGYKKQLHSRLAANFKGWETDNAIFEEQIEEVIRALQTDGDKENPPPSKL